MQCQGCGYPLWNMAGRICPECGREFRPSDYTFAVNAVRYCCPHCDIAYYGTDENGHLLPRSFACVQCQQPIEMDVMVVRQRDELSEVSVAVVEDMPWLDRSKRGLIRRLFATMGLSMANPTRIIRNTPLDAPVRSAYIFAMVMHLIAFGVGVALPVSILMLFQAPAYDDVMIMLLVASGVVLTALVIASVWAAAVHGILFLTGETTYPIRRTYHAMLFSSGPVAIAAVPCVGPYLLYPASLVWWSVSAILMVMVGQKVSGVRAAFAVLGLPLLLIVGTFTLAMVGAALQW